MSKYQRPWWLLVNKPAALITTVHEQTRSGERGFIIRGEPLVQGLAWLTWGPIGALLVVLILTGIAITLDVSAQSGAVKLIFVAAFLGLPALAWGAALVIANRFSARHLKAERAAEALECHIWLNQKRGELIYQTPDSPTQKTLPFEQIRRVRVAPPIGARDVKSLRLVLETSNGAVVLLPETLGTQTQKIDLSHEIQAALQNYSEK